MSSVDEGGGEERRGVVARTESEAMTKRSEGARGEGKRGKVELERGSTEEKGKINHRSGSEARGSRIARTDV